MLPMPSGLGYSEVPSRPPEPSLPLCTCCVRWQGRAERLPRWSCRHCSPARAGSSAPQQAMGARLPPALCHRGWHLLQRHVPVPPTAAASSRDWRVPESSHLAGTELGSDTSPGLCRAHQGPPGSQGCTQLHNPAEPQNSAHQHSCPGLSTAAKPNWPQAGRAKGKEFILRGWGNIDTKVRTSQGLPWAPRRAPH